MTRRRTGARTPTIHDVRIWAHVSRRVNALREAKRWSHEDLASACGLARTTVRMYADGTGVPRLLNLYKLAHGLGVEVGELLPSVGEAME